MIPVFIGIGYQVSD